MTNPYGSYREADPSFPSIIFTGSNGTDVTTFLANVGAQTESTFTSDPVSGAWSLTVNGVGHPVSEGDAVVATVDPTTQRWISRQWCADPTTTPVVVVSGAVFSDSFVTYLIETPPQPTPTF